MSDFIREVEEEYRRERVLRFLSRYQVLIVLAVVAIVVGAGVWRFMVDRRVAAAEADNARYQASEKLARTGAADEARKGFDALAADGVAAYPLLASLRAAEELAGKDPQSAAKAFDAIASGEGGSQALRDTARFRGALLRVDTEEPKAFENQYGRFAVDGFTFHDGMRELLALDATKRGDLAAARRYLDDILADSVAPPALRNRAEAFRQLVAAGPASATDKPAPPAQVTPPQAAAPQAAASPAAAPQAATPAAPASGATPSSPAPAPGAPPASGASPAPAPR